MGIVSGAAVHLFVRIANVISKTVEMLSRIILRRSLVVVDQPIPNSSKAFILGKASNNIKKRKEKRTLLIISEKKYIVTFSLQHVDHVWQIECMYVWKPTQQR